jgi:hypothetical protein
LSITALKPRGLTSRARTWKGFFFADQKLARPLPSSFHSLILDAYVCISLRLSQRRKMGHNIDDQSRPPAQNTGLRRPTLISMISARTRGASKHLLDPEAGAARADLCKPFSGRCELNKIWTVSAPPVGKVWPAVGSCRQAAVTCEGCHWTKIPGRESWRKAIKTKPSFD